MPRQYRRVKLRIIGIDCASCANVAERALRRTKGIKSIGINYVMDVAYIEFDGAQITKETIKGLIKKEGYDSIIER